MLPYNLASASPDLIQFPLFLECRKDSTEEHEFRYFWKKPTKKMPGFVNWDYRDVGRLSCQSFEMMASWFVIEILGETYWSIIGPISNITAIGPDGDFSPR